MLADLWEQARVELFGEDRARRRPYVSAEASPVEDPKETQVGGSTVPIPDSDLRWAVANRDLVFVGREPELGTFEAELARSRNGSRRLLLLRGEPGIGKTRLAAEGSLLADASGGLVLYGRCDRDSPTPYQPFVEALRYYTRSLSAKESERCSALQSPMLRRFVPGLTVVESSQLSADPESERVRLFDAVDRWLSDAASVRPVVLVLDDLHWADPPTIQMLRWILRSPDPASLLVVGSYRDTDLDPTKPLADAVVDWQRNLECTAISLYGLTRPDLAELASAVSCESVAAEGGLVEFLQEQTSGNPLFAHHLLRHLEETGRLKEEAGAQPDFSSGTATPSLPGAPPGVSDLVTQRLAHLGPVTTALLTVGAVVGPEFDLGVVLEANGLPEDESLVALDEAIFARLIDEVHDAPDRYTFAHALVRQVLYDQLATSRRLRIHHRVALALEARCANGLASWTTHLPELAHHFHEAGIIADPGTTTVYLCRAGDQAMDQVAYEMAAFWYQKGLSVLGRADSANAGKEAELLVALGTAQTRAGNVAEGKASFVEAAALARRCERADLLAACALGYGGPLAQGADIEDPEAVKLLEAALAAVGDGDRRARALLLARLAQSLYYADSTDRRAALSDEAIDLASSIGDGAVLAECLTSGLWALYRVDRVEEWLAIAARISDLAESADNRELQLKAAQCRLSILWEIADVDAARETARTQKRLAEELRQPQYLRLVAVNEALDDMVSGRFDEAEGAARRALAMTRSRGKREAAWVYGAQIFAIRWLQGRLEEQLPYLEQAVEREPWRAVWRSSLCWAAVESGSPERAGEHLSVLIGQVRDGLEPNLHWWGTIVGVVTSVVGSGDERVANELYEMLLKYEDHNCTLGQAAVYGAAAHYLGLLAATAGRPEDAERHLRAALARHDYMASPPLVALTLEALGSLLLTLRRPGDAAAAVTALEDALTTATDLGMRRVADRSAELLRSRRLRRVRSVDRQP
jgi:predicted ATPase